MIDKNRFVCYTATWLMCLRSRFEQAENQTDLERAQPNCNYKSLQGVSFLVDF
jgi:hypothetical protein